MSWLRDVLSGRRRRDSKACALSGSFVLARPAASAKPRVTINRDGWIRHPGGRFPFDEKTCWVVVLFEGGGGGAPVLAIYWPPHWWYQRAENWRYNIVAYRIVASPSARA